jgi:diguanylate cyclase (GGDEF)-like protein
MPGLDPPTRDPGVTMQGRPPSPPARPRRLAAWPLAACPAAAHAAPITLDAPLVQAALGVGLLLLFGVLWLVRGQLSTIAGLRRELTAREAKLAERDQALGESAKRLEELHALLKDMSLRDALTGLYNRRCLDQVLLEAWKAATNRREPLSLLMIDIDHFKQLNDKCGHAAGDDCLREVANRLQRHATTLGGVVARYGGEEFVVVLAATDADIAHALAEALRNAVAAAPVKTAPAPLWVTISVGAATARPQSKDSLGAALKRADEALYRAKREGRNRVVAG